ncbi:uncharacterized protein [Watersipora subatra]|uniref:uncharacterized protein n=1 Tax=Watersipora subatra TaxID=2589382 RepID=UPI00355BEC49
MTSDYGTTPESRAQLSGYFDVNDENVTINKGYQIFGPCTKKKKCCAIAAMVVTILVLVVIIVAAVAVRNHKTNEKQGTISSLKSGQVCTGDKDLQNQCSSGKCIQKIFICDGYRDCPSGEDEVESLCDEYNRKLPCTETQFKCLISRDCIDKKHRCNGKYDCGGASNGDYSDERNCFSIDQDTEIVSVMKHGDLYPVKASIDSEVAELICLDMGFKSLQYINPSAGYEYDEIPQLCASLSPSYEPTDEISFEEDEVVRNMKLGHGCSEGSLSMTCDYDFCGVFGNNTGPKAPYTWISKEMTEELKNSKTEFPWVVDIFKNKEQKCKGVIVANEWVLTYQHCLKDDMFYGPSLESAWKVVAGETTGSSQERLITKVMKNQFEASLGRESSSNIVAVQVFPPFDLNDKVHQVCLAQPAVLPHFTCFLSATPKLGSEPVEHVRIILKDNSDSCKENGSFCYEYPHAGDEKSCLDGKGSPISCFDPAKNSWTLAGISTTDIGCGIDDRLATSMSDQYNFYWAEIVTSPPNLVIEASECRRSSEFQKIRFQSGSRQGEVYLDVLGWGALEQWHTLYNISSGLNILVERVALSANYPTVRVANNSGITSKRVAFLRCPAEASSICSCKFDYRSFSPQYADAPTLHFIDDANENGRLDAYDYEFENWDVDDFEDLEQEYEDYEYEEPVKVADIFPKACEEAGKSEERQCLNSTGCVKSDYICDGLEHCIDGSDEYRATCERYKQVRCPDHWFKCRTTFDCIPRGARCNGINDCNDLSDERECVAVLDNNIVFIEQRGLPLPLGGMLPQTSNDAEDYLASALCSAMGFGPQHNFSSSYNENVDFSQGCYKLKRESLRDPSLTPADFTKHPKTDCDEALALICNPPGCGVTTANPGPVPPSGWPKLQNGDIGNKDYPWVVHVMEGEVSKCVATVVDTNWIVTTFDCISDVPEVISGLTAKFTDLSGENRTTHNIINRANHLSTKVDSLTGEPIEKNIAMFEIYPPFEKSEVSNPLCVLPPLYIEESRCYVSGHDKSGALQHVRVVTREAEVCEDAGLPVSKAFADEQCIEYLDGSDDTCIKARGGALQCLDALRNQWKFTAIMTTDIGKGCSKLHKLAVATKTEIFVPWMFDMLNEISGEMTLTCKGGDLNKDIEISYRKSNYEIEWYLMTTEGKAIDWAGNESSLALLTQPLVSLYGAFKVTSGRPSEDITAVTTITVSDCEIEGPSCRCSLPETPTPRAVEKFFLISVDKRKEAEIERTFEEENVIADYDYSTPFYSSTTASSK